MTFEELQMNLNFVFDKEDKHKILEDVTKNCDEGYFFVDGEGECYLLDEDGNLDDVRKIKILKEEHIKKDVKKIKIPDSIMSIKDYVFYRCSSLTSIMIPNSVTSISDYTFAYCSDLTNVKISNNVTSIGFGVFRDCSSLTSMTIPNNVIHIEDYVFSGCSNLKKLIFKGKTLNEVKSMANYPFGIGDESIIKVE